MSERHDDHEATLGELAAGDVTAEFWGTTRGWTSTGSVPRVDRSGPIQRTRTHHTGPIERTRTHRTAVPVAAPAPVFDDLDDGFDDGFDDDVDRYRHEFAEGSYIDDADHDDAHHYAMTMSERGERRSVDSMVTAFIDRIGLGNVDPLLVRVGALIMVGVLLVPLAMALRADAASDDSVRTTTVTPEPTPVTTAPAPGTAVAETPGAQPAAKQTLVAEPVPTAAPASTETPSVETTSESVAAAASAAAESTAAAAAVNGPATADEVAVRVEPVCALVYTAHEGDYWLRIADAAGVSLAAVLDANLASSNTPIYPGDDVCLPAGAQMPSAPPPPTTAPPATTAPKPTAPPATTAPKPTAPPTTAPAPITQDQVVQIIRDVWPDDLEQRAIEIAYRESRLVPTAYNGWCCYGLFQIHWEAHRGWLDDIGITAPQQLYDARVNAQVALQIYVRAGGWGPWT